MKLSSSNRTYITLVIVLLVTVGILAAYLLTVAASKNTARDLPARADTTGILVCLPHKNSDGPQTLECAYGLRTDDGVHYGLKDLPVTCTQEAVGARLRVSGSLARPDTDNIYDIIGIITTETCTKE